MIYDFAIIGAGVIGTMIARELSMYQTNILLLDKAHDVSTGATKANSGIVHAGYDAAPGSLKAKMNVLGCKMMEQTTKELDVPFIKCGSIVAAFDEEGLTAIQKLYQRGQTNQFPNFLLNPEQTKALEPRIHPNIKGALYAKTAGIVCPYKLAIAAAENAVSNGVTLKLNFEVTGIRKKEGFYEVESSSQIIQARTVLNCAGVFADKIARMVSIDIFYIRPRKENIWCGQTEGRFVNTVEFNRFSKREKEFSSRPRGRIFLLGPYGFLIDDKKIR